MSSIGKYVPITVEQIAKDTITQISSRFWSPHQQQQLADTEAPGATALEPYTPQLIDDIYKNELAGSNFSLRRVMLLEFSQYLECYLWPNYESATATRAHLMSIVVMVNEKFRERVFAWDCFRSQPAQFAAFFDHVLRTCLERDEEGSVSDEVARHCQEQTMLVKFLDNCVNSLEVDMVRVQVQKICGLPMWHSLSANKREHEFAKHAKLRKFWKALEKNDARMAPDALERARFERRFLRSLIVDKFLLTLAQLEQDQDEAALKRVKLAYLEHCFELLIDLEALLPTRRFFNTLLADTNMLIHCSLSKPLAGGDDDKNDDDEYRLFRELFRTLKFYSTFEIDDQTGEAKSEPEVESHHYDKLKELQKGVFKYYRSTELHSFSLTNIATIDQRQTLLKHLNALGHELLHSLAVYLNLVAADSTYDKQLLIEIIIWHMERPQGHLDELNAMPLYPTEDIIWNESLVPSGGICVFYSLLHLQLDIIKKQ